MTYDEIMSLNEDPRHARFNDQERAVPDYAAQLGSDSRGVTDELFTELRRHYSEPEILNFTLMVGLAQLFGHLSNALDIPMDSPSLAQQAD